MAALALCEPATIEILLYDGRHRSKVHKVCAHRFLDFAVHRSSDSDLLRERWNITHLPSGRLVASGFSKIEPAAEAMVEIARLRNDWSLIEDGAAAGETTSRVQEIVKRHDPRANVGAGREGHGIRNSLNGYGERTSA